MAAKQLLTLRRPAGGAVRGDNLQALDAFIPPYWNRRNPIHILRNADTARYAEAAAICLKDPGVDGLLVIYTPQDFASPRNWRRPSSRRRTKTDKPLLTAWMGGREMLAGARADGGEGHSRLRNGGGRRPRLHLHDPV